MKKLAIALLLVPMFGAAPIAPITAPAEAQGSNCVHMGPISGGSFWQVTNNCGYRVIGKFCYENDKYFNCGTQSPGGFGPISPGRSEGVSSPSSSPATWRVSYCDYDDWNAGDCRIDNP